MKKLIKAIKTVTDKIMNSRFMDIVSNIVVDYFHITKEIIENIVNIPKIMIKNGKMPILSMSVYLFIVCKGNIVNLLLGFGIILSFYLIMHIILTLLLLLIPTRKAE